MQDYWHEAIDESPVETAAQAAIGASGKAVMGVRQNGDKGLGSIQGSSEGSSGREVTM